MKKNKILLLFLLFFSGFLCCRAQKTDTTYIGIHEQNSSAQVFFGNTLAALSIKAGKTDTEYRPNTPVEIGIGFAYKGIGASFGYGFDFMRDKKKGNTKVLNFLYHHYARRFIFDFYLQKYTGFYIDEGRGKEYEFYPQMKLELIGGSFQYVFNGKRFSYRAAFNQTEKQLKSAGSFQLGAGVYYNRLGLSGTPIEETVTPRHNVWGGPIAGYVYTWVIKKCVTITPAVSAGINMGFDDFSNFEAYPTVLSRFSAGYVGKSWSVSVTSIFNFMYIFNDRENHLRTNINSMNNQVTFIKRFNLEFKKK